MVGLLRTLFGLGDGSASLDETAWQDGLELPLFEGLADDERQSLKALTLELLADKDFSGAGGAEVDGYVRTVVAMFAALPVLNLGAGWYGDWREVVIYPGEFVHAGEEMDEAGIVHPVRHVRSGEAMHGGPLVLSWDDVASSGGGEGYNVVIHEFAHKLDMKNGAADGLPPLHPEMSVAEWAHTMQVAFDDFSLRVEGGERTAIDPYAAENPAEFFAVLSESFFECPAVLHAAYPGVYRQFRQFYRQHPLGRRQS